MTMTAKEQLNTLEHWQKRIRNLNARTHKLYLDMMVSELHGEYSAELHNVMKAYNDACSLLADAIIALQRRYQWLSTETIKR